MNQLWEMKKRKTKLCKNCRIGSSLVFHWLEIFAFPAVGLGSIPGQGTEIQKKGKKRKELVSFKVRDASALHILKHF